MKRTLSRRLAAALATLLFAFGNNYCILSAYAAPSASGMSCHRVEAPAAHACCSGSAQQERAPAAPEDGRPASPCCMLATTEGSGPAALPAPAASAAWIALASFDSLLPAPEPSEVVRIAHGPPPGSIHSDCSSSRAPPRA